MHIVHITSEYIWSNILPPFQEESLTDQINNAKNRKIITIRSFDFISQSFLLPFADPV